MFNGLYFIKLFKKIAASVHDGLDPLPEPPAGLHHSVPGQAGHHLLDLHHHGGGIVVGSFINVSFTNAPYIIVERVAVRAARRPDLLQPELREVLPAPVLRRLAVVGRRPFLLEHVVTPSSDSVHPELNHLLQNLDIFLSVDLQPLGEDMGRHHITLVADHAQHHDRGRKLCCHHNRDLTDVGARPPVILLIYFLISAKIILVCEKDELVVGSRILKLVQHQPCLLQPPLLGRLAQKLAPSQRVRLVADNLHHFLPYAELASLELPRQRPHGPALVLVDQGLQLCDDSGVQGVSPPPVNLPVGAKLLPACLCQR